MRPSSAQYMAARCGKFYICRLWFGWRKNSCQQSSRHLWEDVTFWKLCLSLFWHIVKHKPDIFTPLFNQILWVTARWLLDHHEMLFKQTCTFHQTMWNWFGDIALCSKENRWYGYCNRWHGGCEPSAMANTLQIFSVNTMGSCQNRKEELFSYCT